MNVGQPYLHIKGKQHYGLHTLFVAMYVLLRIHLSNVLTDHLNILTYIKAWLLLNNMYYTMTTNIHFILEDLHQVILKTEQNSAHNIGLNHTTPKSESHNDPLFMIHQSYNAFSKHVNVPKQYSKLVIWTLWTWISDFEYIGMTLTSTETTLIETLL